MNTTTVANLITSEKVTGTEVYGSDGKDVGHIDHLVIDKETGNIVYAVMHFGGFLGMGETPYSIPWEKLRYDKSKGGYLTDITKEQLEGAPPRSDDWVKDRGWEQRTHEYYGVVPYWHI